MAFWIGLVIISAAAAVLVRQTWPQGMAGRSAVIAGAGAIILGAVLLQAPGGPSDRRTVPAVGQVGTSSSGMFSMRDLQPATAHDDSVPAKGLATVDEMIERLARRLQGNPDDPEGWRMLGWSYFSTERYTEAAAAYARAVALRPDLPQLQSLHGEAIVRAANGAMTPPARAAFARALAHDAKDSRARFFAGLAKEQDGDRRAALDDWIALLNDSAPHEEWVADLEQRVTGLGREMKIDITERLAPRKGPSSAEMRAAASLPAEQRDAMVRGMVEGLARRLEAAPRDEPGWIKLVHAHAVLGDMGAAKAALHRAMGVFGEGTPERSRIATAARDSGVEP